ncbi:hypothetical protein Lal_00031714 [Lupinus albus]|nr:hypothetical protein Lal_00031714 [Lupinus albus]
MRVPVARLPTSSRGPRPPEARAVGDPRGEGYIPHLAWATRRAGAKSVFLKPKVETKSLTMWCAASPLAMPHGALAWCPVCGSWSAVVGCFVHGVWFLVRDPEC